MSPDLKEDGAARPTPTSTPTHGQAAAAGDKAPPATTTTTAPEPVAPNATVLRAAPLSRTVRGLVLGLDDGDAFTYEAGQWVDLLSEGFDGVGGFSMCAPPSGAAFRGSRELELAVKLSRHPPAAWVHDPERCRPGARVRVRAGGRFTLALAQGCDAALFLAGGIGVTALAAMAGELSERWQAEIAGGENTNKGTGPRRAAVLYSARGREELALLPRLRGWAAAAPGGRMRLQLYLTSGEGEEGHSLPDHEQEASGGQVRWRRGRITAAEAKAAIDALADAAGGASSTVGVFICGPPVMTDELAAAVAEHPRVGAGRVFTEKWW